MGIEKLAQAAVASVMLAAATGQLPKLVRELQLAQFELLKDSQSSKWGRAMLITGRTSEKSSKGKQKAEWAPKKR